MPSHKSNVAPIKLPKDDIDQNKPNNLSNIVPIAKLIKNPVTFSITHVIQENKIFNIFFEKTFLNTLSMEESFF